MSAAVPLRVLPAVYLPPSCRAERPLASALLLARRAGDRPVGFAAADWDKAVEVGFAADRCLARAGTADAVRLPLASWPPRCGPRVAAAGTRPCPPAAAFTVASFLRGG